MVWVLLIVIAVLAILVGVLALRVRRLERCVASNSPSRDPHGRLSTVENLQIGSLDEERADSPDRTTDVTRGGPPPTAEYVITRVGEPEPAAPTVPAPVFVDLVLKETVVHTASLFQGIRRALSPETRNRIRFHMRQEVKRSRKQRRAEMREVRREWAARQRRAAAEESAA